MKKPIPHLSIVGHFFLAYKLSVFYADNYPPVFSGLSIVDLFILNVTALSVSDLPTWKRFFTDTLSTSF